MLSTILLFILPVIVWAAPPSGGEPENVVDMSHRLRAGMPNFPGHEPYRMKIKVRGHYPGTKMYVEYNTITLSDHAATHLDAPAHFARGKWRTHDVPLRSCFAEAFVIDISDKARRSNDAALVVQDIERWESKFGKISEGSFVFLSSGWSDHWKNSTAYLGSDSSNFMDFRYPGWDPEACKWLVDNRQVKAIGTDAISVERVWTDTFGCHKYLSDRNILIYESVANLDRLPPRGATVYAFPLNIQDGSGSPLRMVAMWNAGVTYTLTSSLITIAWTTLVAVTFAYA